MYLLFSLLFFISTLCAQKFPVEFINQTQIANDADIYIIIKGLDIKTGDSCFIAIDPDGTATCQPVNESTKSTDFSYKLSDIKAKTVFLPFLASGRIYISIGEPMQFQISEGGIVDADGFKPRDPNYYTLYDKVEFSYVPSGGTWMNPTAVDFFSIPLRIEQSGSDIFKATGISASRNDFLNQVQSIIHTEDLTPTHEWSKVLLTYTDKEGKKSILRLMSPGKAMSPGVPGTKPMDQNYLDNKKDFGFSYIEDLWDYYRTNTVMIDCSELQGVGYKLNDYVFIGKVEGNDFVFTNRSDPLNKIVIPKPSNSIPWFAGAQGVFDAPNNTPKAIIVRQLTAAFDVGLLPAENGVMLDRKYFDAERDQSKYFIRNPLLDEASMRTGPWFDLYSMALHSFGKEQPIYTFAYDDALGQDGTLHDPHANNISKAVITIGDMSGTVIPAPFQDSTAYSVTVLMGKGSKVTYEGRELKQGEKLENVTVPMKVELNGEEAEIYFNPAIVLPDFKAADGIVIELKEDNTVNLIFPGLPNGT